MAKGPGESVWEALNKQSWLNKYINQQGTFGSVLLITSRCASKYNILNDNWDFSRPSTFHVSIYLVNLECSSEPKCPLYCSIICFCLFHTGINSQHSNILVHFTALVQTLFTHTLSRSGRQCTVWRITSFKALPEEEELSFKVTLNFFNNHQEATLRASAVVWTRPWNNEYPILWQVFTLVWLNSLDLPSYC